jgi:hypothetical protein
MDTFTQAYIDCAKFTEKCASIAPDTLETMVSNCARFQMENAADIAAGPRVARSATPEAQAGHDFWLTRNRHGVGFWDGDWPSGAAGRLTVAAHEFGEFDV